MGSVIDYIPIDSPVHRLKPLSKLLWTIAVMIIAMLFNHFVPLMVIFLSVLVFAQSAKILKRLLPSIKGLAIFGLVLLCLQVLFTPQGEILFFLLPGKHIPVTMEALQLGLAMALRMMSIVISFLVFLATTQYKDINLLLSENFKLPYDYVFMFMTALRFVPSFLLEMQQVRDAQVSRACPIDGRNPFVRFKAYTQIAVPLVMISLQKAERLAVALETRGFGNRMVQTSNRHLNLKPADSMVIISTTVVLIGIIVYKVTGII